MTSPAAAFSQLDRLVGENAQLKRELADARAERDNIYALLWDSERLNEKLAREFKHMRDSLTSAEDLIEELEDRE